MDKIPTHAAMGLPDASFIQPGSIGNIRSKCNIQPIAQDKVYSKGSFREMNIPNWAGNQLRIIHSFLIHCFQHGVILAHFGTAVRRNLLRQFSPISREALGQKRLDALPSPKIDIDKSLKYAASIFSINRFKLH